MKKLTQVQKETMDFCIKQIEEAENAVREGTIDVSNDIRIEEAIHGIVYTQGGNCTIKTLNALEKKGLIQVLEDNSGIGTSFGAFPSKVKVLIR